MRNQLVHGTRGGISSIEINRVQSLTMLMYGVLSHHITHWLQDIFDKPKEKMLQTGYQNQVAWLGKIKYLYPSEYRDIDKTAAGSKLRNTKVESMSLKQTGGVHLTKIESCENTFSSDVGRGRGIIWGKVRFINCRKV